MENKKFRALDIGCGSGILSIFLFKKGTKKIFSVDIDPFIIKEAKKNIRDNIMKKRAVKIFLKDISFFKKHFQLIIANVPINVHSLIRDDVKRLLTKDGLFLSGGLLKGQVDSFLSLYSDFKLEKIVEKDDWFALRLKKPY